MKTIFQRTIWIAICASFYASTFGQQYRLSGRLTDEKGARLENVTVMITAADTLVAGAVTDAKGEFSISGIAAGTFFCKASLLGYKALEQSISVKGNTRLQLSMQEDSKMLSEVTVNAHREDIVTSNASSTTFLLSENAQKKSRDAFEALREIPKLRVDVTSKTVALFNGSSPLILIDGVKRPSYIYSINPEDIEAVEVVENPSARYRGEEGITSMINIRLKRKKDIYLIGNLSSNQHIKFVKGVTDGNLSLGNDKFSIYMAAQAYYSDKDKNKTLEDYMHSGNLTRRIKGTNTQNSKMIYGAIGSDWVVSDKDYWAFGSNIVSQPMHNKYEFNGTISHDDKESGLSIYRKTNVKYLTNSNNLYYKHTYSKTSFLELTATANFYKSATNGLAKEQSKIYSYDTYIDMDNYENSCSLKANYQFKIGKLFMSNLGNNLYHDNLSIDETTDNYPKYKYKDIREYIYFDFIGLKNHKFTYNASLGLDLIFTDADKSKNHYVNFVPSVSLAYKILEGNSIKLYYNRNRQSPDESQLNPRNTSTDSLKIITGNPYLRPQLTSQINLSYEWSHKAHFLSPFINFRNVTKSIEGSGKTVDDIYYYSYYNQSSYQMLETGLFYRLRLGNIGNLNLGLTYVKRYFVDDYPYNGKTFGAFGGLNTYYKNVNFSFDVNLSSKGYFRYGKSTGAPSSHARFSWNMPRGWTINMELSTFIPHFDTKTWGFADNYESYSRTKVISQRNMLMIGISYNFKNKVNLKYRNSKRFYESDKNLNIEVK